MHARNPKDNQDFSWPRAALTSLFLLAATLGAGASATAQVSGDPASKSVDSCQAQLSCVVGQSKHYGYSATFVNQAQVMSLAGPGYGTSTLHASARVGLSTLERSEDLCTYGVTLSDVSASEIVRGEIAQEPGAEDLEALVGGTFYFTQASDGRIVDVELGRDDLPEAANFKRGVVNALNMTLRPLSHYEVQETDISGTHLARYQRQDVEGGTAYLREIEKRPLKSESTDFRSTQKSRLVIDPESCLLNEATLEEWVVIDQPTATDPAVSERFHHETLSVHAAASMNLLSIGPSAAVNAATKMQPVRRDRSQWVRLPIDAPLGAASRPTEGSDEKISELLEQLRLEKAQEKRDAALARRLMRAVKAQPGGLEPVSSFIAAENPTGAVAEFLAATLAAVMTPEAQNLLVDLMTRVKDEDEVLSNILGLSTLVDQPTRELVDEVSWISTSGPRRARPAATLALGAFAGALRESAPELSAEVVSELEAGYRVAAGDLDVVFLRALGNAGAQSSLPLIAEALQSSDRALRLSAVTALRKIGSDRVDDLLLESWQLETSESVRQAIAQVLDFRSRSGSAPAAANKANLLNWQWSQNFGGSFLSADMTASAVVEDSPYLADLRADSIVNGPLGFTQDVLAVQALTESTSVQNRRFRLFINILGNDIATFDDTETCSVATVNPLWSWSQVIADLDTPPIPILGPLTLSFSLDLDIDVEINYSRHGQWCSSGGSVQVAIVPKAKIKADGYATLDLILVRGGVGIDGTLIDLELPLRVDAQMENQDAESVCFTADLELEASDLELYAWGQARVLWSWQPSSRPHWTLWDFPTARASWPLVDECTRDPNERCLPHVGWWDGSVIDAGYDGANCFVASSPEGSQPFIANHSYYIVPDHNCPPAMPLAGTVCLDANIPAWPWLQVSLFDINDHAILHMASSWLPIIPPCPSGWTQLASLPGVLRVCGRQAPPGFSSGDFFLATGLASAIFLNSQRSCPLAGHLNNTGCLLGNAPAGTNPFVWNDNFYYAEP